MRSKRNDGVSKIPFVVVISEISPHSVATFLPLPSSSNIGGETNVIRVDVDLGNLSHVHRINPVININGVGVSSLFRSFNYPNDFSYKEALTKKSFPVLTMGCVTKSPVNLSSIDRSNVIVRKKKGRRKTLLKQGAVDGGIFQDSSVLKSSDLGALREHLVLIEVDL